MHILSGLVPTEVTDGKPRYELIFMNACESDVVS